MSRYEKKALLRFLALYAGSTLFLIGIIAFLAAQMEQNRLVENQRLLMQHHAARISAAVVDAHMSGLTRLELPQSDDFKIGLYDAAGQPIYSEIAVPLQFRSDFFSLGGRLYWVDLGARLHWGVKYIVVKENTLEHRLSTLRWTIAAFLTLTTLFVCLVAFWLSRLFLEPLKEEMRRRDRFVQDTTHELATPVSSLLLSLKDLKGEEPQKLGRITAAARAIAGSYQNLTHLFMRDQEARVDTPIDLAALVKERIGWHEPFAAVKKVLILSDLEPLEVTMDLNLATRLIDNLLQNAVKYSHPGGRVTVHLSGKELRIKDEGVGIDPADQERIFKRYQRAEANRGGFGIGLDIVRGVCETYGITLTLNSKRGAGAEFVLRFV